MKTMKRLMALLLSLTMILALAACGGSSSQSSSGGSGSSESSSGESSSGTDAAQPTYNWIFNATMKSGEMDTNPGGIAIQYFNEQVQERSNGQIKITMYTDGQLANSTDEVITGALSDSFQLFNMPIGNLGGYTDAFRALDVPYLFLNSEQVYKMMDSAAWATA